MRPIDADEIVRKVKKQRAKLFHKEQVNAIKQIILSFVNEAPTLDVQSITYCKDCIYYNSKWHKCLITYNCHSQRKFRADCDYCSSAISRGNNG